VAEIPEKTERAAIVAALTATCAIVKEGMKWRSKLTPHKTRNKRRPRTVEINIRTRLRVRGNSKDNRKVNNARRCGNTTENEAPHASELLHLIRRAQTEAIIYRVIIQNYDRHTNDIFV